MENINEIKKNLLFADVFSIATGAMISSGIFILPGVAFAKSGPAVIVAYVIAGLFALIGSLSMVELTTAMPKAGGSNYFVSRSLGPFIGSITGFLSWFAITLKTAFAIFGLAILINQFTGFPIFLTSVILTVIFTVFNIVGVKEAAKLQVWMVFAMLLLMVAFFVGGSFKLNPGSFTPF